MTDYAHIRLESHGHVALATLDRPGKLNALNGALRDDILHLAQDVRSDDEVRVLVITGAGRGFCSGADLTGGPRAEHELSQNERLDEWGWVGRQALALHELDKPVIAAMNGVAAGAGMSLALSCDLRVGGPGARFRTVFAERSLSPDSGMSYFLTRILGYARAADLVFTSRDVDAAEAYRLGLLDRLVGEGEVVTAAAGGGRPDREAAPGGHPVGQARAAAQHRRRAGRVAPVRDRGPGLRAQAPTTSASRRPASASGGRRTSPAASPRPGRWGASPVTISESPAVVVAVIWAALRPFTPSLTRAVFHTWLFHAASVGWAKSPSTTRLARTAPAAAGSRRSGGPRRPAAGWRAPSASGARTARPSASRGAAGRGVAEPASAAARRRVTLAADPPRRLARGVFEVAKCVSHTCAVSPSASPGSSAPPPDSGRHRGRRPRPGP